MGKPQSLMAWSMPTSARAGSVESVAMQSIAVALLTILFASSMICLAAAKDAASQNTFRFEYVTVTLLQELCKLGIAFTMWRWEPQEVSTTRFRVRDFLRYGIPGLLYCFDNNFQYVVLGFLQPAELAILWNFKIFWTALLLHVFLGRHYSAQQWGAMIVLLLGCAMTQTTSFLRAQSLGPLSVVQAVESAADSVWLNDNPATHAKLIGVAGALLGSSAAAAGNVFCEYLYKQHNPGSSMNFRNMQLYTFGVGLNLLTLMGKVSLEPDSPIHGPNGFFTGYNGWVWTVIAIGSISGLSVSAALKLLDNIVVIFAHALAMLVVAAVSSIFFGLTLSGPFVGGGMLVLVALLAFYSAEECISRDNVMTTKATRAPDASEDQWMQETKALLGNKYEIEQPTAAVRAYCYDTRL